MKKFRTHKRVSKSRKKSRKRKIIPHLPELIINKIREFEGPPVNELAKSIDKLHKKFKSCTSKEDFINEIKSISQNTKFIEITYLVQHILIKCNSKYFAYGLEEDGENDELEFIYDLYEFLHDRIIPILIEKINSLKSLKILKLDSDDEDDPEGTNFMNLLSNINNNSIKYIMISNRMSDNREKYSKYVKNEENEEIYSRFPFIDKLYIAD